MHTHTHTHCPSRCECDVSRMLHVPPEEFLGRRLTENSPAICWWGIHQRLAHDLFSPASMWPGWFNTICSVCHKLDELMMLSHFQQSQIWLKLLTDSAWSCECVSLDVETLWLGVWPGGRHKWSTLLTHCLSKYCLIIDYNVFTNKNKKIIICVFTVNMTSTVWLFLIFAKNMLFSFRVFTLCSWHSADCRCG